MGLGLAERGDDVAHALRDLAGDGEDGTGGSGNAREGKDGALRAGIHVGECLASVRYAVDYRRKAVGNVKQRFGERPANLDSGSVGLVLERLETALKGLVALVYLFGERGVVLPRRVGASDGFMKNVGVAGESAHNVGLPDALDAELGKRNVGCLTFVAESVDAVDKGFEGFHRRGLPLGGKLVRAHAGDTRVLLNRARAVGNRLSDVRHDLRHGGAARFGLDAERGHSTRHAEDFGLREVGGSGHARESQRHMRNVGLGSGEVVAKVNDGGAVVAELVLAHGRDVGELGHLGCRSLHVHVRRDVKAVGNVAEALEVVGRDAELCAERFGVDDLCGGDGLRSGRFERSVAERLELVAREVRRLVEVGERGVEIDGLIYAVAADYRHRDRDVVGERAPDALNLRARVVDLVAEILDVLAGEGQTLSSGLVQRGDTRGHCLKVAVDLLKFRPAVPQCADTDCD